MAKRKGFKLNGHVIAPGTRATVELPVSLLSDHTPVNLSVHAIHGRRKGPTVFVSAAVHGDEVVGVEICRRLLQSPLLSRLRGTLLVVPIVNSFGFQNRSRYLPDRRDLNRSFPGYARGSLASRLAEIFLDTVVKRCDLGIDLHSAAVHRTNLPQVRINRGNERMVAMAEAFGAPVVLTSELRDGSLRAEAKRAGIDVLLYEAGEGLRFDEMATRAGVAGILRVLGKSGQAGIERAFTVASFDIGDHWPQAVEDQTGAMDESTIARHAETREDRRDMPYVTIDSPATQDMDDALLVEPDVLWGRDMETGRQLLPDAESHDGFFYAVLEKPEP